MIKRWNFNTKIRSLQLLNHLVVLLTIVLVGWPDSVWLWTTLATYYVMFSLGVISGFHRLLSHKSYTTSRFWEIVITLIACLATVGSSIGWSAIHRLHHANSDLPKDPHSPYINRDEKENRKFNFIQSVKSWIGLWYLPQIEVDYVKDLIRDPFHQWVHRHYFKIIGVYCLVLFLINPLAVVYAYALPASLTLHATSVIIVISHIFGYRNFNTTDESRNHWLTAMLTFGEGWHNNHHARPGNFNFQVKWWEIDVSSWFIRLIKKP